MKKHRCYVGQTFRWDFTENWQQYVTVAKKLSCRFDAENKCWIIPNGSTAKELVRALLEIRAEEDIVVHDFDDLRAVPAGFYISPDYLRSKSPLGGRLALGCSIEGRDVYLAMPLDDRGKAAPDHAIYEGLATVGCRGEWVKEKGYLLKENAREAVDFLIRDGKVALSGVPQLFDRPFVVDLCPRIMSHQEVGVSFLVGRSAAILADDMGLGKTMQSILAAEGARAEAGANALLVVCPVSLVGNWRKELKQWESSFARCALVPYSQMKKLPQVLKSFGPDARVVLIADEAHYLKNPASQRTKEMIRFVQGNRTAITATWLLTGTPVTRDFSNLWPLASLLNHPVAETYAPSQMMRMSNREILRLRGALSTHMLVRKKCDVLNLPPKIRGFKEITTGAQMFASLVQLEVFAFGKDEAAMEHLMTMKRITAMAKVQETVDVAQQVLDEGRKVVLFSDHTAAIDAFVKAFPGSVMIDGGVNPKHRPVLVERFQTDPNCRVFIGNIKAAGVGLTLTAAQDVVFNDLTWLPADIHQAEDRCHRIGTTGTVNVWYMVDSNLILDKLLCDKLADRSAEIATFEQSQQSILKEIRAWAKGEVEKQRRKATA